MTVPHWFVSSYHYCYRIQEFKLKCFEVLEWEINLTGYTWELHMQEPAVPMKPENNWKHLMNWKQNHEQFRLVKQSYMQNWQKQISHWYWLQKAYEERYQHILYLKPVPVMFSSLRSDPRFVEIYNKVLPVDD